VIALFLATAFAGDRVLEFTFTGPEGDIATESWTLPVESQVYEVVVGGQPHVVTVSTENRHDTVVVIASVDYLKGKKLKPVRISEAKLILYESYPGEVTHTTDVPKGWTDPSLDELTWTTGAVWNEQEAAPVEEPPVESPDETAPPEETVSPDEAPEPSEAAE